VALQAVILNKAISLVVVASALPFRAAAVPFVSVAAHWPIIVNLLAGSLLGAWLGAGWATRLASQTLSRVIAGLLLGIAVVLVLGHDTAATGATLTRPSQMLERSGNPNSHRKTHSWGDWKRAFVLLLRAAIS
jgi:uncharacterized protein